MTALPSLWTIIIDFDGGTYLRQTSANSPSEALRRCFQRLKRDAIPGISATELAKIRLAARSEVPVTIRRLRSVYCATITVNDKLLLANLVCTKKR